MYTDMSDEDKIRVAIDFVAQNQPLPEALTKFLKDAGIYEAIVIPQIIESESINANSEQA